MKKINSSIISARNPSTGNFEDITFFTYGIDTELSNASENAVQNKVVKQAIDNLNSTIQNLPEPMVFKGSLGVNGTITSLPIDGSAAIGDTYKVITNGTYASQSAKVGDTFICLTKTSNSNSWELVPSGDEVSAGEIVAPGTTYVIDDTTYTVGTGAEIFNAYIDNKAAGDFSHAEGCQTSALGSYSHTEGCQTSALGSYSHTEGYNTTASDYAAHAEGIETSASENAAHAEGFGTDASGLGSHAEGLGTIAIGEASHAQNYETIAASHYQTTIGKYNIRDDNDTYSFIIGNGNGTARSNAFAVDWNGLIYVNGAATGVDVQVNENVLKEVVNKGQKNLIGKDMKTETLGGITFTPNSDGTVSTSSGTKANSTWYRLYPDTELSLKAGSYVLSDGLPEGTFSGDESVCTIVIATNNDMDSIIMSSDNILADSHKTFTTDQTGLYVGIRIAPETVVPSGGWTIKPMLCTESEWNLSNEFVPYSPTNRELELEKTSVDEIYGRGTAIPSNSNLNNYTTPGVYYVSSASVSGTISNSPDTSHPYRLEVKQINTTERIHQTLIPTNFATDIGVFYTRIYSSAGWRSWFRFEGTIVQ